MNKDTRRACSRPAESSSRSNCGELQLSLKEKGLPYTAALTNSHGIQGRYPSFLEYEKRETEKCYKAKDKE